MKSKLPLILAITSCVFLTAGQSDAALTLTVSDYTTGSVTLTISGTLSAATIGESKGYIAIKNDWVNNKGIHTEWFSGVPTITLNTIQINGENVWIFLAANGETWGDSIYFSRDMGEEEALPAGTPISGSVTLTGANMFNPANAATLNLVSGFVRPAGADDWARVEASGTAAVPEPTAALLGALGVLALFRRRR